MKDYLTQCGDTPSGASPPQPNNFIMENNSVSQRKNIAGTDRLELPSAQASLAMFSSN